MNIRLYLDTRNGKPPYPVRLGISRKGETAYVTLSVKLTPEQWDSVNHRPRRLPASRWAQCQQVTNYIERQFNTYQSMLLRLEADGKLFRMSAREVRDYINKQLNPEPETHEIHLLRDAFNEVKDTHTNPRTREIYACAWRRILRAVPDADTLTLEDITPEWLQTFDDTLAATGTPARNARNVYLHCISAAMNHAANKGLTNNYPFRQFKTEREQTAKRSITSEQMRRLVRLKLNGSAREYRDIFLLIFCLLGINMTDLLNLRQTDMQGGRITYRRAKTGKLYDIKVQPETLALIERYRGTEYLLSVADRYTPRSNYNVVLNAGLKQLIPEPPFNKLSTYWARHSWATIAFNELGASVETISTALGHRHGSRITAIYINPDTRKVDELNRQLLDLLFK